MKSSVIGLSFFTLAFGSHAQLPPEANAPSGKPDVSRSERVASPNRTSSRTWATSGKAGKARQQGDRGDRGEKADSAAIKWVDSTGRTMGRAIGNYAILATFDNQLATITGLYPDQTCDANRVCTYPSNGARWSEFESVYYTTPDCTGLPYSLSGAVGTPYLGVPVVDSGGAYLYFFKAVDTTRVTLHSSYSNNVCFQIGIRGAFPTDATPVSDVLPASTYGTPPFFLK
ncbi:hypothetical protein [Polaromonas sp.]|uniref:hypothetical protein n=1 Tax=Polaromonas sp. TaxID=1869339 RepID=UPI0013B879EA|nr:hypothetical protein [Polaromonas sp.]NDP62731.1 hypothetical protein [Polaromonas sp.]